MEGSSFSVSHTLEYSFSAYAVAQWAKALGRTEDYKRLMELSDHHPANQHLYTPATDCLQSHYNIPDMPMPKEK